MLLSAATSSRLLTKTLASSLMGTFILLLNVLFSNCVWELYRLDCNQLAHVVQNHPIASRISGKLCGYSDFLQLLNSIFLGTAGKRRSMGTPSARGTKMTSRRPSGRFEGPCPTTNWLMWYAFFFFSVM